MNSAERIRGPSGEPYIARRFDDEDRENLARELDGFRRAFIRNYLELHAFKEMEAAEREAFLSSVTTRMHNNRGLAEARRNTIALFGNNELTAEDITPELASSAQSVNEIGMGFGAIHKVVNTDKFIGRAVVEVITEIENAIASLIR